MDLTETIAPRSDQINADDLIPGPVTVTVTEVVAGTPEQPVDIRVEEYPGRAYRPSKSMRRVIVSAWGVDSSTYLGRKIRLYRNPEITFGREKVGGIEIEALSHIDEPLSIPLTATRGKRRNFTVKPLAATPAARDWASELLAAEGDVTALTALWGAAKKAGADETVLSAIAVAGKRAKGEDA